MKKITSYSLLLTLLSALLFTGCAIPKVMLFNVDVIRPAKYPLNVDNVEASVFATYSDDRSDSAEVAAIALAIAHSIETANALEEGTVGAYTIPASEYKGTGDTEYMEGLMMASGSGNLIIVDSISIGYGTIERDNVNYMSNTVVMVPIYANVEIFNAIADSTLFRFKPKGNIRVGVPEPYASSNQSIQQFIYEYQGYIYNAFGERTASLMCDSWEQEEWMIVDYPSESIWHEACKNAMDFKWDEALKAWIPFTEDQKADKASYAAFNIAVACQMMGKSDLAENWIEYARRKYDFSEAEKLHNYLKIKKTPPAEENTMP